MTRVAKTRSKVANRSCLAVQVGLNCYTRFTRFSAFHFALRIVRQDEQLAIANLSPLFFRTSASPQPRYIMYISDMATRPPPRDHCCKFRPVPPIIKLSSCPRGPRNENSYQQSNAAARYIIATVERPVPGLPARTLFTVCCVAVIMIATYSDRQRPSAETPYT